MQLSAYDTLVCRNYAMKETLERLTKLEVENELARTNVSFDVNGYKGFEVPYNEENIPVFSHPVYLETKQDKIIVLDTRPFIKRTSQSTAEISNITEFNFLKLRGMLQAIWMEDPNQLLATGELPVVVFMRWLGGAISSKLGLNLEDQVKLNIITVFFWYSLFKDEPFNEKEKLRIVNKLQTISYIPATQALVIADKITQINNIETYVNVVKELISSSRLEKFNAALLFSMLSGSWFGLNAKELIAVATEHPPTFIAIISQALDNRGYRKTAIGNLVFENDKKRRGHQFSQSITNLLN